MRKPGLLSSWSELPLQKLSAVMKGCNCYWLLFLLKDISMFSESIQPIGLKIQKEKSCSFWIKQLLIHRQSGCILFYFLVEWKMHAMGTVIFCPLSDCFIYRSHVRFNQFLSGRLRSGNTINNTSHNHVYWAEKRHIIRRHGNFMKARLEAER